MISTILSYIKFLPLFYLINQLAYYRIPKIIKGDKSSSESRKEINFSLMEGMMIIILFFYCIKPEWFS